MHLHPFLGFSSSTLPQLICDALNLLTQLLLTLDLQSGLGHPCAVRWVGHLGNTIDYVLQKAGENNPVRRHKQPRHDFHSPTATFYRVPQPRNTSSIFWAACSIPRPQGPDQLQKLDMLIMVSSTRRDSEEQVNCRQRSVNVVDKFLTIQVSWYLPRPLLDQGL